MLVVGDAILDRDTVGSVERVAPDAPVPVVEVEGTTERPGGAGLAARLLAGRGAEVVLASCHGADAAGARLRELLAASGVGAVRVAATPATRVLTRIRASGQSV